MAARTTGDEEGQLVSSDTLQASGIELAAELGGLAEPPVVCAVKTVLANDGGPAPEPPPRAAAEAPPARASTAFRVPPPVDAFLERQMQQQLAQLAAAEPPEPDERRKGFVLFQAMPGGLFSAIVHMLVFLVLSVYVANDPTGARSVSLQVVDAEQDETDVDEFVEMVVEEPADAEEETLEVAPDQAFLDNVMLDPPEIAHPEVVLPDLEEVARELEVEIAAAEAKPGRDPGFTVGEDARGGLARRGDRRGQALTQGATAESENAVELALQWLVRHHREDGSWCFNQQLGEHACVGCQCSAPGPYADALNGATGMVLLALLGAGHTQLEGKYRDEVAGGLRYLIEQQAPDGSLMDPSGNLYSHGLATLALCEALAMTRDGYLAPPTATPRWGDPAVPANGGSAAVSGPPGGDAEGNPPPAGGSSPNLLGFAFDATAPVTLPELTHAAQQAVTFIERAQHPAGGWRYRPRQAGDTSVVGWQLMALKSAYLAGLKVDSKVAARATRFLDMVSEDRVGSCYGYTYGGKRPYLDINTPITATTPIGLLCRMYTGWEHKRPGLGQGVERLKFWARPGKGLYYYYYATQVMHHYGGSSWEKWNAFMRDYLVQSQSQQGSELGSWMLDGSHDDAGRLYCTAMAAMTLEVYYRYSSIYSKASVTTSPRR
jgi:hypothetical protein